MNNPRLINQSTGCVIVERLTFAATFWTRFRGLQLRKILSAEEGLLIAPCRSIHTHWMRFAIDVAMVDRSGVVVEFHSTVRPWRMLAGDRSVAYVLEATAGQLKASVGDQLGIEANDCSQVVPDLLRHLVIRKSDK
jgi:uncharacterized membrane protein (UPF0127 family)